MSQPPSKDDLKKKLTAEQYRVTQEKGTEPAFTGAYYDAKDKGTYVCICCDKPLFSSKAKFDSGTGWPSFYETVDKNVVKTAEDLSMSIQRTEVKCRRCGSHLGHVFGDAPDQPTSVRFCINSAALDLKKDTRKQAK